MVTANHTNGTESAAIAAEAAASFRATTARLFTDPRKAVRKSIKGIDFNTIGLPFMTVAKASGMLPDLTEAQLGAAVQPKIREVNGKNTVMRGKDGRILTEVIKPVLDNFLLVHRAMVYQYLESPVETFRASNPEAYAAQVAAQERAGAPVLRAAQELVFMSELKLLESSK